MLPMRRERSNEKVYTPTGPPFRGTVCPRDSTALYAEPERDGEEHERPRSPACNYVGILTAEESFSDLAWLCIECNSLEMIGRSEDVV